VLQEQFELEDGAILKALTPFPGICLRGERRNAIPLSTHVRRYAPARGGQRRRQRRRAGGDLYDVELVQASAFVWNAQRSIHLA
jgi:hypothetical protein